MNILFTLAVGLLMAMDELILLVVSIVAPIVKITWALEHFLLTYKMKIHNLFSENY